MYFNCNRLIYLPPIKKPRAIARTVFLFNTKLSKIQHVFFSLNNQEVQIKNYINILLVLLYAQFTCHYLCYAVLRTGLRSRLLTTDKQTPFTTVFHIFFILPINITFNSPLSVSSDDQKAHEGELLLFRQLAQLSNLLNLASLECCL